MNKYIFLSVVVGLFLMGGVVAVSSTNTYTLSEGEVLGAHFAVHTLKYNPFPVSSGEWFDVWVKVENIGQEDAQDAMFNLVPSYPFSSSGEKTKVFGLISGTKSAYTERQPGEVQSNSNQVLLKFHVFVANDVEEGIYNLRLESFTDGYNGVKFTHDLPISVKKPEVDFDIALQDSSNVGTSFAITNIGTEAAGSIIIKVNESEWVLFGDKSYTIGKLEDGEATRFLVQGTPSDSEIKLNISYTDISGIRRFFVQNIPATSRGHSLIKSPEDPPYKKWVFGLIGIFIGIGILGISRKIHNKKRR
ncbi:MAG: hypothetical protein OEL87_03355 [Nanoarchaeota archaeon]|nr:hypothetical protein [Nanoarchaeota archaeon]